MEPVRMNDPCPCGSKKKYKHCHGKEAHQINQHNLPNNLNLLWVILGLVLVLGLMAMMFNKANHPTPPAPTAQDKGKP